MERKAPYEAMYGKKFKVGHLRVFGYTHTFPKKSERNLIPMLISALFWDTPITGRGTDYDKGICRVIHSQDVRFD